MGDDRGGSLPLRNRATNKARWDVGDRIMQSDIFSSDCSGAKYSCIAFEGRKNMQR